MKIQIQGEGPRICIFLTWYNRTGKLEKRKYKWNMPINMSRVQ